jgi:hypothetical protein
MPTSGRYIQQPSIVLASLRFPMNARRLYSAGQRPGVCRQQFVDAWRSVFPEVRGKDMGNYDHFLRWEAIDEVNRELISFSSE